MSESALEVVMEAINNQSEPFTEIELLQNYILQNAVIKLRQDMKEKIPGMDPVEFLNFLREELISIQNMRIVNGFEPTAESGQVQPFFPNGYYMQGSKVFSIENMEEKECMIEGVPKGSQYISFVHIPGKGNWGKTILPVGKFVGETYISITGWDIGSDLPDFISALRNGEGDSMKSKVELYYRMCSTCGHAFPCAHSK